MNTLQAWLTLRHCPDLPASICHRLLASFTEAEAVIQAGQSQLQTLGVSQRARQALQHPEHRPIQDDLDWLAESHDHHIIHYHDPRYPERLKSLSDAPVVLYVRGDPDYLAQPQLAMVGSRNATAAGRQSAYDFARHLASAGITITSGLAEGIDAASHQGALESMAGTVALVAHGLDRVYPAVHHALAEAIAGNGAVVSEMPVGTELQRGMFPRRNRLISGLSIGTLVVEAALRSGSLITARHALEQGREVFAIPGSIHNPLARGCHHLIRQGAKLVETADDILEELGPHLGRIQQSRLPAEQTDTGQKLDPDHQKLLKCLAYEPMPIDELVTKSGYSAPEVASMLLILELNGDVVCEGGRYCRLQKNA